MNKQKLVSAWSDPELFYHKAKSYRLGNYEGDVLIPRVYRKLWRAEKAREATREYDDAISEYLKLLEVYREGVIEGRGGA